MNGEIENVTHYENPVRTSAGETKRIRWHNTLLHDTNGHLVGALSSGEDITDWHQAKQAIEEEKERLATTLRSIGDGVITTDTNGAIRIMNRVAEQLTGWTLEEAQGKPLASVFTIIHELSRNSRENPVQKVLTEGKVVELTNHTVLVSRDGHERIVSESAAPILDNNGRTIGVVLVFRDVTEKRRMADAIQKTAKLESLGILAGGIAHDFNNLLGGIFGYVDLACAEPHSAKAREHLLKALNTLDRARDLTQQLLTFSKGGTPVKECILLSSFLHDTVKFALSGSSISPVFNIDPALWRSEIDKNQISQVIDNLVINAQQAMPMGGTITVSAKNIVLGEHAANTEITAGNYIRVTIADQGIGILAEFLPRIFDPFFTTKPKGHGLGLATSFSIVKRHDGWIDVESVPGRGTTFSILLPACNENTSTPPEKTGKGHSGNGVFVVMDDEESIRDVLGKMLESFGYTVVKKADGKEAVEFFASQVKANQPVAGMIFDLTIPGGMNGKEAVSLVRKMSADVPVFVASGYAEDPVMARPQDYGFTASLRKPFVRSAFAELLNKHMKSVREYEF
ncbi:MAG: PAS domain S-box protein [Deltaproteobacteria bacterium]|nr:PAS domain S-box protein [Deltaproteobacteria bacterium]MBN2674721.1 PAS domain S-box protein [Deltaproteobacteria bacterium]